MRKVLVLAVFLVLAIASQAQVLTPVKWKISTELSNKGAAMVFEATIDEGWHLYDTNIGEGGPIATTFAFEKLEGVKLVGGLIKSVKPETHFDENFQMELRYFSHKVVFKQYVKFTSDKPLVEGYVEYMSCNDETCTAPTDEEFSFTFKEEK